MQAWQAFLHEYPLSPKTNSNSVMDLSYLGLLKISGIDAKKFLQGQLTCNIEEISSTQSRLGAHCNPKGRIISLFRIFYFKDSFYLHMPREMVPLAMQALQKYAIFFKVQLHDASHDLISIGYYGEQLNQFIAPLPEKKDECCEVNDLLIINTPGKNTRYTILGDIKAMSMLWKKMTIAIPFISTEHWKCQDIEAEFIQIYPETSEMFLPHEIDLHLHNGISFNKGCYTGQEIIARMHYRGVLKTKLQHRMIESTTPPQRGSDLKSSSDTIVDFCQKNNNHYQLLILAQKT